jgi:uncharacterized protein YneF (UPF0154 family)
MTFRRGAMAFLRGLAWLTGTIVWLFALEVFGQLAQLAPSGLAQTAAAVAVLLAEVAASVFLVRVLKRRLHFPAAIWVCLGLLAVLGLLGMLYSLLTWAFSGWFTSGIWIKQQQDWAPPMSSLLAQAVQVDGPFLVSALVAFRAWRAEASPLGSIDHQIQPKRRVIVGVVATLLVGLALGSTWLAARTALDSVGPYYEIGRRLEPGQSALLALGWGVIQVPPGWKGNLDSWENTRRLPAWTGLSYQPGETSDGIEFRQMAWVGTSSSSPPTDTPTYFVSFALFRTQAEWQSRLESERADPKETAVRLPGSSLAGRGYVAYTQSSLDPSSTARQTTFDVFLPDSLAPAMIFLTINEPTGAPVPASALQECLRIVRLSPPKP